MLPIYLPIAELSLDVVVLLGLGSIVGFLSGLFGVGGGFLLTPLLIFLGVPPTVAVATQAPQIVASSVSGVIAHWRKDNVDVVMGGVLVASGLAGSGVGVVLFTWLRALGQIDFAISVTYVLLLGIVGTLMMIEAIKTLTRKPGNLRRRKLHQHLWIHNLPFKARFRKSRLYISVLPPAGIGFLTGMLAAIMGVGGGFILVPALLYFFRIPPAVVVGTSLFQILVTMTGATILHAVTNQSVDIILAILLLIGGVIGAQFGGRAARNLNAGSFRLLLALLILSVGLRFGIELFLPPNDPYSVVLPESAR